MSQSIAQHPKNSFIMADVIAPAIVNAADKLEQRKFASIRARESKFEDEEPHPFHPRDWC